jgi:histidine triad (HIT) family protein
MYSHKPENYTCPFCLLAAGRFEEDLYSNPEDIITENEHVIALVASHRWSNNPNTLVIPRAHHENIYTLPVDLAAPIHAAAQAAALALKAALNCDGVSTRQHNEPAGNQDVWHYHLHVTPRFYGDTLYGTLQDRQITIMPPVERAALAALLRDHLP